METRFGALTHQVTCAQVALRSNQLHQRRAQVCAVQKAATAKPSADSVRTSSFEELVRKYIEKNNEEAGEHWTPRAARAAAPFFLILIQIRPHIFIPERMHNLGRRLGLFGPLVATVIAASANTQPALPPDAPGSKDHALTGRYEGSRISAYQLQHFALKMLLSQTLTGASRYKLDAVNTTTREGRVTQIAYQAPTGRSSLEVFRNQVSRLTANGFRTMFTCEVAACVDDPKQARYMSLSWGESDEPKIGASRNIRYALLERDQGGALTTVSVRTAEHGAPNVGPRSVLVVVEAKSIDTDKMVFVDASAMQAAMASNGRIALYGILFDTDKAEIKPESKATLEEIAKFLRANEALALVVTGHTDAHGAFDYNVSLATRRATAVVAALVRQHGIAASRLTPFGAGMAAPVASNEDEGGRSRNRWVELVKRQGIVNK